MNGDNRDLVRSVLEDAVGELSGTMDAGLIPEAGCDIAYALADARDKDDVAAVQGRILYSSGQPRPSGPAEFGASEPMARILLTAMKFDPDIRSAATIRCNPGILLILEDLMLETCSFDGKNAPPGTRTMDWGVASCCRSGVPDVIFDRGASRSEPMAWVLGQDPREVAAIISRISHRLRGVQEKAGRTGRRGE